jgi:hypothetical protein
MHGFAQARVLFVYLVRGASDVIGKGPAVVGQGMQISERNGQAVPAFHDHLHQTHDHNL